jgi:DNA-binding LytR/AlgR family response regulator
MITDDEPIAREILESYIQRTPDLNLVKSCCSATEAFEGLYQYPVDAIFLDIQMPTITGTEFLRSLRKPPLVVFTTAYSKYTAEGLELDSVDYLLKPITFERFELAVQKIKERMAQRLNIQQPNLLKNNYIFIKQDFRLVRIGFDDIKFIQAERDFCMIFLESKKLLANMHLKLFEQMLPVLQFARVHRSYIVNLNKIQAIKGNVIEIGSTEIPIGANYKDALFSRLGF